MSMTSKKYVSNRRTLLMTSVLHRILMSQHTKIRGWFRLTQYSGSAFLCGIFGIAGAPSSVGNDILPRDSKLYPIINSDWHGKSLFAFVSGSSRTVAAEGVRLVTFISTKLSLPPLTITSHTPTRAHSMIMPRYVFFLLLVPHVPLS